MTNKLDDCISKCLSRDLVIGEIVRCLESLYSSSCAHNANIKYVLNRLHPTGLDDREDFIKHLGLNSFNVQKSILELQLICKNGNEQLSAGRQLVNIGDSDTIRKFSTAISASNEPNVRDILESYLEKLRTRINSKSLE
jgi:hypothetical protein